MLSPEKIKEYIEMLKEYCLDDIVFACGLTQDDEKQIIEVIAYNTIGNDGYLESLKLSDTEKKKVLEILQETPEKPDQAAEPESVQEADVGVPVPESVAQASPKLVVAEPEDKTAQEPQAVQKPEATKNPVSTTTEVPVKQATLRATAGEEIDTKPKKGGKSVPKKGEENEKFIIAISELTGIPYAEVLQKPPRILQAYAFFGKIKTALSTSDSNRVIQTPKEALKKIELCKQEFNEGSITKTGRQMKAYDCAETCREVIRTTEDVSVLTQIRDEWTNVFGTTTGDFGIASSLLLQIQAKIDLLSREKKDKDMPELIKTIAQALSSGAENIAEYRTSIDEEAKARTAFASSGSSFALSEEDKIKNERKKIAASVLELLTKNHNDFRISNPTQTALQANELLGEYAEKGFYDIARAVVRNLMNGNNYQGARNFCEKLQCDDPTKELYILKALKDAIESEIQNASISNMFKLIFEGKIKDYEQLATFYDLIKTKLKKDPESAKRIILEGKITLYDVWHGARARARAR